MSTPTRLTPRGFDPALGEPGDIPPGAIVGGLVYGIDISNYQPWGQTAAGLQAVLDSLSPRPFHVVTRLSLESNALRAIAIAQLHATVQIGALPGGYAWCYASSDPRATVQGAIQVARDAGARLPILWLDLEDPGSPPGVAWVRAALDECASQGVRGGIYSGPWWLQPHLGTTQEFAGVPFWNANYNGRPDLNVPTWDGLVVVAHQYNDKTADGRSLDLDVFLPDYVVA